jgi:hypothetical protein
MEYIQLSTQRKNLGYTARSCVRKRRKNNIKSFKKHCGRTKKITEVGQEI